MATWSGPNRRSSHLSGPGWQRSLDRLISVAASHASSTVTG
jgi:hypothetical protein